MLNFESEPEHIPDTVDIVSVSVNNTKMQDATTFRMMPPVSLSFSNCK